MLISCLYLKINYCVSVVYLQRDKPSSLALELALDILQNQHGVKGRALCIMVVPAYISRTVQVIVPFNCASCESMAPIPQASLAMPRTYVVCVCYLGLRYGRSEICVVTHVLLLGSLDSLGIRNRLGGECSRQRCRAVHLSRSD
jgi:hypothetical protein